MEHRHEIAASRFRAFRNDGRKTVIAGDTTQSRAGSAARLMLLGLGISVVPLDTAVNIAFPEITGGFGLPIAMIQWVVICYVLTHAGLMLACGRIGDMWGHARVFRAGLLWSIVAFLLCAAAPGFGWLLFARFLQGISAGLILSCAPALVTSLYPEARRSHALGTFTLMFAIGSAAGPLIGGLLVARWGWPAVFWFRAPIALISLVFLRGLPRAVAGGREQRFDIVGAALLALGLAALLLAVNGLARIKQGDYLSAVLFPAAVVSLGAFVWWERRAPAPIVRIELFRRAVFAITNLASSLVYLLSFSVMLIAPYFLKPIYIGKYGTFWGGIAAGGVLASGFIAMSAVSPFAGRLVARLGPGRIAPLGALFIGTGLFLVGAWRPDSGPVAMVLTLALQGAGTGLFQVAYLEIVIGALPVADRGVAGSLAMLTRTIGTVTGAALLTLGFQIVENAALAGGSAGPEAFLTAFGAVFRSCGIAAALVGALVAVTVRWSASGSGERGL
jgi:MFS family permease